MTMFLLFVFPFACPNLSVSSLFGVCCMLYVVSCRTVSCSAVLFYGLGFIVVVNEFFIVIFLLRSLSCFLQGLFVRLSMLVVAWCGYSFVVCCSSFAVRCLLLI